MVRQKETSPKVSAVESEIQTCTLEDEERNTKRGKKRERERKWESERKRKRDSTDIVAMRTMTDVNIHKL